MLPDRFFVSVDNIHRPGSAEPARPGSVTSPPPTSEDAAHLEPERLPRLQRFAYASPGPLLGDSLSADFGAAIDALGPELREEEAGEVRGLLYGLESLRKRGKEGA